MQFLVILILIIQYVDIINSSRRNQYKPFSKAGSFGEIDIRHLIVFTKILGILFFRVGRRIFKILNCIRLLKTIYIFLNKSL